MWQLMLYAAVASVFSLLGGLLIVWRAQTVKKIMTPLIAFAAGAFLGVSFLDLLPEAVAMVRDAETVFVAVLIGFFIFFALERFLMKYFSKHSEGEFHGDHTESISPLLVLGDSLHNFLDGIIIALAYVANPALGLTTALAVAAHELPQEIGDFAVLLDRGWSKTKIIIVNFLSASLALVGAFLGYLTATSFETSLGLLLAAVAGIFIYLGASNLIPEVHHRAGHKNVYRVLFAFLLGLVLVGYLVLVTEVK